ncbi:MAG: radical SAM protein [Candidatus Lokiarchaeota archaeon]|nr:radical SAM protein [Candidatus Lokiarchaeota archaeon]
MSRTVKQLEGGSLLLGELPLGCRFCSNGSKMVLFVTGLCDSSCYYCPLSIGKREKDLVFADEMPVKSYGDILFEAKAINAEGVGISGGDPLCVFDRTVSYIRQLKESFGEKFHIHLYTCHTDVEEIALEELRSAGLDEIRFHPQTQNWSGIETALKLDLMTGIEIPVIPGKLDSTKKLLQRAEALSVSFVNLNELEASETNFARLRKLGFQLTDLAYSSILGSKEDAISLIQWGEKNLETLSLHFCSATFKDSVQMRNRLSRRIERTIREFEEQDADEPLVILGVIRSTHGSTLSDENIDHIVSVLHEYFEVPMNLMNRDYVRSRIEIAPWILEEISLDIRALFSIPLEIGIVYEYPTWDRLQVLFEPV